MPAALNHPRSLPNANPNEAGECDGCYECCVRLGFIALDFDPPFTKRQDEVCQYVGTATGTGTAIGCSVYEQRPKVCRDYMCWAKQLIVEAKRPDIFKHTAQLLTIQKLRTVECKF